jgi:hypothetical protein
MMNMHKIMGPNCHNQINDRVHGMKKPRKPTHANDHWN